MDLEGRGDQKEKGAEGGKTTIECIVKENNRKEKCITKQNQEKNLFLIKE